MEKESFDALRASLSIMDLAIQKNYRLLKNQGMKHPVLKHPDYDDKIIITNPGNSSNQGYWNPHDDSDRGHIYHFIKRRLYTVFREDISSERSEYESIIAIMHKYADSPVISYNTINNEYNNYTLYSQTAFELPKLENIYNHTYLQQRGIKKETIENALFKDRIFSVQYGNYSNIAFPYRDSNENIIGLELNNYHYKKFTPGSNKKQGIWLSNLSGQIKEVYLFESVMDALSYHQLKMVLNPHSLFVSFGGNITGEQLITLQKIINKKLFENQIPEIICCTDNDAMGTKHFAKIKAFFDDKCHVRRDCPHNKDFNEDVMREENEYRFNR